MDLVDHAGLSQSSCFSTELAWKEPVLRKHVFNIALAIKNSMFKIEKLVLYRRNYKQKGNFYFLLFEFFGFVPRLKENFKSVISKQIIFHWESLFVVFSLNFEYISSIVPKSQFLN